MIGTSEIGGQQPLIEFKVPSLDEGELGRMSREQANKLVDTVMRNFRLNIRENLSGVKPVIPEGQEHPVEPPTVGKIADILSTFDWEHVTDNRIRGRWRGEEAMRGTLLISPSGDVELSVKSKEGEAVPFENITIDKFYFSYFTQKTQQELGIQEPRLKLVVDFTRNEEKGRATWNK